MATIYIDGKEYEVDPNKNLLHVGLSLGLDIPYFCWHPAMGSVGACRQCAVKQFRDENDQQGKLVMACMTPASDGTRISINDPEAVMFRAEVIEWLMINHPHDCPICDEGGECHLQDMTVMTGHSYRRYRFRKRTYRNQYLGPFVNHEMNRCIQCYRCVRFYKDHAGGDDLDVFGAHDQVYFGRKEDGVLESEFSGNLVEVCPTGVFTDKTLKQHYTRKWDLTTAPSVCVNCGIGCNTIPGERYGKLRRILNRYNRQVNGYFICDRGRYGYEFVNSEKRIRQPLLRRSGTLAEPVSVTDIQLALKEILESSKGVIGIGSPRTSLENNFALHRLVGSDHFFVGISDQEYRLVRRALISLQEGPARSASLHDAELSDAVLVLGEDLTNTAPMLAYAMHQSVRNQPMKKVARLQIAAWNDAAAREVIQDEKGPLFIATPAGTKLDKIASRTYRAAPDDIARLGFAVANAIDGGAPQVSELSEEDQAHIAEIAAALKNAERPLVISGTSLGNESVMQAAANVAWALAASAKPAGLTFTVPEPNSLGLVMMGGGDLRAAYDLLQEGAADTLVILENDLYRRADAEFVDRLLDAAQHVIVLDHLENRTTDRAEITLPAATFAEGDGTFVNNEGRAQRFLQVYVPDGDIQESWRWLRDMNNVTGRQPALNWANLDHVSAALAEGMPVFAAVPQITPPADFRIVGQKIPREPHRYSGRTAILANISVHEPKPPDDPDVPLAFSMEGYKGIPPAPLIPRYWAPGWNSVQALNKFQSEVGGPLLGGDPGIRLIEPAEGGQVSYYDGIPQSFNFGANDWLVVPLFHIFGSDELSIHAPGVAELTPDPYLALNSRDAERLQVSQGDVVEISIGEKVFSFPLKLDDSLPTGLAGLPVGLPAMPAPVLPEFGTLKPAPGSRLEESA